MHPPALHVALRGADQRVSVRRVQSQSRSETKRNRRVRRRRQRAVRLSDCSPIRGIVFTRAQLIYLGLGVINLRFGPSRLPERHVRGDVARSEFRRLAQLLESAVARRDRPGRDRRVPRHGNPVVRTGHEYLVHEDLREGRVRDAPVHQQTREVVPGSRVATLARLFVRLKRGLKHRFDRRNGR